MNFTGRVLKKAVLANGPIPTPKNIIGMAPIIMGNHFRNSFLFGTTCFMAYYYSFRVPVGNNYIQHTLHNDRAATADRLRERGIVHVGADPAYHEPATWQTGREQWESRRATEKEILLAHIEQYDLKVGKHGYETPFDTMQA